MEQNKQTQDNQHNISLESGCAFDLDEILSITDPWDLEYEKLQVWRDDVQQCLDENQDFFKSQGAACTEHGDEEGPRNTADADDKLTEAENTFNSVAKDAPNGAYRVFKKQLLALKLRSLEAEAESYCVGRPIPSKSRATTYLSEKCWSNLPHTEQKKKKESLARWRGQGEKWLSLEEPAIVMAFRHIPSGHRSINEFERRRLPISAFNAVVRTLQAMDMIRQLRELWCRQLIRNSLGTENHLRPCFCNGTDYPEVEFVQTQWSGAAAGADTGSTATQFSHVKSRRIESNGENNRRIAASVVGQSTQDVRTIH